MAARSVWLVFGRTGHTVPVGVASTAPQRGAGPGTTGYTGSPRPEYSKPSETEYNWIPVDGCSEGRTGHLGPAKTPCRKSLVHVPDIRLVETERPTPAAGISPIVGIQSPSSGGVCPRNTRPAKRPYTRRRGVRYCIGLWSRGGDTQM